MKYIKTYENNSWTINKLRRQIINNDIETYVNLKGIKDYIRWKTNCHSILSIYEIYFDINDNIVVKYADADYNQSNFIIRNEEELINFLNNPEILLKADKFNM